MTKKSLIIVTHSPDCYPSMEFEEVESEKDFVEFMQQQLLNHLRSEVKWATLNWRDAYRIQDVLNRRDFSVTPSSCAWHDSREVGYEWEEFDGEDEDDGKEYLVRLVG